MSEVLSTKLAVDEVDLFSAAGEQQGLSKSGLLKNLVEEYLGGSNEENKTSSNNKLGNSSSLELREKTNIPEVPASNIGIVSTRLLKNV